MGHEPSRHQTKCRRNRRLRQDALEDRERRLQRDEKSRLRARTQFRPWSAIPGDDAREPEPPRLRLAHGARIAGAPLDSRARGGHEANQLLRSSGHAHRLRDLSLLARLPRSPRDLHHPARAVENPKNRMRPAQMPTFRIAVAWPRAGRGYDHAPNYATD